MAKPALSPPLSRSEVADVRAEGGAATFDDVLAYRESVFRICLGFSRDFAEAEDLAQDVFVRAFGRLKGLRNPRQAREWLFRLTRNACLDHCKKDRNRAALLHRWARETLPDETAPKEGGTINVLPRLKSAVRTLPKKLGEVFVLREYGRLSYDDIATTLGVPKGTVMSRLNRARTRVAATIEERKP
jgi:RNA polymerase sigma-70 factor (ECF subfamily)